jgi:subtilisin family serine protease
VKRLPFRVAWPLLTLLAIPLVYNSCQGGLMGSGGFKSSASTSCKAGLEKGVVTKLELQGDRPPKPFALSKVRLREDSEVSAKASPGPIEIEAGKSLGVLVNNECLQSASDLDLTVISKAAADSGTLLPDLDRQAYEWTLDRSYTDLEIEAIAGDEPCVIGISWNREYKAQATFNDAGQANQTHLVPLRALESFDRFYAATWGMTATGTPIVMAVVDTGVDWKHPDLQNNMWSHGTGIGIDITTVGTSLVDYNPFDISNIGHGTHVSGLIAAVSNNGLGVIGLMPARAQIMGIKIFKANPQGELTTTSQYFYNALRFAHLNGAHVINLSLGSLSSGPASDSLAESGVDEALTAGVTVITVIGNSEGSANGQLVDGTTFSSIPAQYATRSGVLAVGSYDIATGQKSFFSHYSPVLVEISAPGAEQGTTGVYSTIRTTLGNYGRLAGTSQAGPMVAAAAGLTIGLIREAYGITPTPAEVERLLVASAVKAPSLTTYFKDGNKLDFLSLAQKINADYPLTAGGVGGSTTLPSMGCAR